MTLPHQKKRASWLLDLAIAIFTLIVAVLVVIGADRDHRRVEPPGPFPDARKSVRRPEWIWRLNSPYQRFMHDYVFVMAVVTLGAGAMLVIDRQSWTRRGLTQPGKIAVVLANLLGITQVLTLIVARWPTFNSAASFWYDIRNNLEFHVSGAVLGAWVVSACCGLWRPARDWKERLGRIVGWGWLGTILLLLGYGVLFG